MVADIFEDMTNKGGIFYDMQQKQANTLYGIYQKLTDIFSRRSIVSETRNWELLKRPEACLFRCRKIWRQFYP